ncbi:GNVR domain-containing protein, partial [Lactococcus chungangensis]
EAANLLNVTNVNILSKAKVESTPTSPKPKLYLAISIVIGLILGLALALLKEVFDNKINKEEDIEALGLSVLGVTAYAQTSDFSNPNYKKETLDSDTSMSPDEQELSRLSKRKKR